MPYIVFVDDNFHYMDQDSRLTLGRFESLDDAIAAGKKIVDEYLTSIHVPGMTAAAMFEAYCGFGEDPFIVAETAPDVEFSAWSYAEQRAAEICRPNGPP